MFEIPLINRGREKNFFLTLFFIGYSFISYAEGVSGVTPTGPVIESDQVRSEQDSVEKLIAHEQDDLKKSIIKYKREIQKLEADYGPYDNRVGENLLSIGTSYHFNGQYEEARIALNRALQIKRISEGIHGLSQLAVLEQLITTNIAAANWEELDQNYQLLLWVHKRNFEVDDPKLLPVIDKVGRWKLKAYSENLLDVSSADTIGESEKLYKDTIKILESQYGKNDPRLINPLYGRALTNYQFAIEVANTPQERFRSAGSPTREQVVCHMVRLPSGAIRRVCNRISVPNPNYYANQTRGKNFAVGLRIAAVTKALERIVKIHEQNPDLDIESHARALVHLGDWNLFRSRKRTAFTNYNDAYQLLAADEKHKELINTLFSRPRSIPTLKLPLPAVDKKIDAIKDQTSVVVSFDISVNGKARNIKIIESNGYDESVALRKVKKQIKNQTYRPRIENGVPVNTINNKTRMVFKD